MSTISRLAGTTAFAALALSAGMAQADLTADQVWQAWQGYAASGGASMEAGSITPDGPNLVVRDVAITASEEDITVSSTIDEIVFTETGDGRVAITQSDSYSMTVTADDGSGVRLGVSNPGVRLVASETATGILYDLTLPELVVSVDEIFGDDAPEVIDMAFRITDAAGQYEVPADEAGPFSADISAGQVSMALRALDDDNDLDFDYGMTGLTLSMRGARLDLMDDGDFIAALQGGFSLAFQTAAETTSLSGHFVEFGERNAFAFDTGPSSFRFEIGPETFAFSTSNQQARMMIEGADLPMPQVEVTLSELTFGVGVPLMAGADQQTSVLMRMVDLVVPDEIWGMFDPMGALSREPATMVVDLVGSATLPADLFSDEAAMGIMMGGPMAAGMLDRIELRELLVRFGGAELTGAGGFTVDYDDLQTFGGLPKPVGEVNLALRGGNALIDTLVGMGMLPDDQAMAARMGLALFARPGDGPDELLSTIEVREDGAVLANGQRIQ